MRPRASGHSTATTMRSADLEQGKGLCQVCSCRASTGTTVRYCRASGEGLVILLSVHELVDDLCKKAASLCAGGGNAGDCGGVTCPYRASTWENAIHILCMKERRALSTSRTAMSDK